MRVDKKTCSSCKVEKDLSDFNRRKVKNKDGDVYYLYRGQCRECYNVNRRKNKNYSMTHWIYDIKRRAKKRGFECDLDIQWLKETLKENNNRCPVLDIPLSFGWGDKGVNWKTWNNSPSVDRIDNKFGYLKWNCDVMSQRANCLKGDATYQETKQIHRYLEKKLLLVR